MKNINHKTLEDIQESKLDFSSSNSEIILERGTKKVHYIPRDPLYFKTGNNFPGELCFKLPKTLEKTNPIFNNIKLEISIDKVNWEPWDYENENIHLQPGGQTIYIQGNNEYITNSDLFEYYEDEGEDYELTHFEISNGYLYSGGNINSIIGYREDVPAYCFAGLFCECQHLITPPEIPSTQLSEYCYYYMFAYCNDLIRTPLEFPATTLANSCYYEMFCSCTHLIESAPLPAEYVSPFAYRGMFFDCENIISFPELKAKTFGTGALFSFFYIFNTSHALKNVEILNFEKIVGGTGTSQSIRINGWLEKVTLGKYYNDLISGKTKVLEIIEPVMKSEIRYMPVAVIKVLIVPIESDIVKTDVKRSSSDNGGEYVDHLIFKDSSTGKYYLEDKVTELTEEIKIDLNIKI